MKYRNNNSNLRKQSFLRLISIIINYSSISFFILLFVFVSLQVILRYVFKNPLSWTEELSRFSMIWLTYIGSIAAMREQKHISIDILSETLPSNILKLISIVSKLITLSFLLILFYYSLKKVLININIRTTVTEWPLGLIYMCLPISAIGMIFYLLLFFNTNKNKV